MDIEEDYIQIQMKGDLPLEYSPPVSVKMCEADFSIWDTTNITRRRDEIFMGSLPFPSLDLPKGIKTVDLDFISKFENLNKTFLKSIVNDIIEYKEKASPRLFKTVGIPRIQWGRFGWDVEVISMISFEPGKSLLSFVYLFIHLLFDLFIAFF